MPNNANQRNSMTWSLLYATLGVGYVGFSGYLAHLSDNDGLNITDNVGLTQNQCSALSVIFGICGTILAAIGYTRAYYSYTANLECTEGERSLLDSYHQLEGQPDNAETHARQTNDDNQQSWRHNQSEQQTDTSGNRPDDTEQSNDDAFGQHPTQNSNTLFANTHDEYPAAGATDIHSRDVELQITYT